MNKKHVTLIHTIDKLIRQEQTGNAKEFSQKLNISRSTLFQYLGVMKERGAPIVYSRKHETFFYQEQGHFKIAFKIMSN
jgi:hypothetical protein